MHFKHQSRRQFIDFCSQPTYGYDYYRKFRLHNV